MACKTSRLVRISEFGKPFLVKGSMRREGGGSAFQHSSTAEMPTGVPRCGRDEKGRK